MADDVMRRPNAILEALELFRDLFPGISMGHMIALLYVFENEGLTLLDLSLLSGFYLATASRAIRAFCAPDAPGAMAPALSLVELRQTPRGKAVLLTERGRKLRDEFQNIITESAPITGSLGPAQGLNPIDRL